MPKLLNESLSLDICSQIADYCLTIGRQNDLSPLTIVILDVGGHIKLLKREDGSGIMRNQIAGGKAYGALGMGMSSRDIGINLKNREPFLNAASVASQGRFIPVPGGVLILNNNDKVIGSIGVSGDTSYKDEFVAIKAVQAVGLNTSPTSPNEEINLTSKL
eukprot:TRINITY_DN1850_c0_g1_i1.p1 TRINITY_DN1850_c0_g1~~TRINITY_DN1850_c0_g1_i1.p1  ORF type:complete len:161 (+),score=59.01 TRINITY_DN1850_c0_g1_i1:80-562(+)